MMTVGQHDNAWLDVMTDQVPAIRRNLVEVQAQLKYANALGGLHVLREYGVMNRNEYLSDVLQIVHYAGLDDESIKKYQERIDKKFPIEEEA